MHHTFVGDPPLLVCLGAILDVVVRCSGSLSKLVDLYRQDSSIAKCCWHTALNTLTHGRRSYRSTQCENPSHLACVRTIAEILKSLIEDEFKLDIRGNNFYNIDEILRKVLGGTGTTSNSHGALACLSSGNLALVPESTQPGDLVAGLLLLSFTDGTISYLVMGDRPPKGHDLEASLTEISASELGLFYIVAWWDIVGCDPCQQLVTAMSPLQNIRVR